MHQEEVVWVYQSTCLHAWHLSGACFAQKMFRFIYHLCCLSTNIVCVSCLGQIPKVADTCNFQEIMDGYYKTLFPLNPGSIRPIMPSTSEHEILCRPHGRESLSSSTEPVFVK